MAKKPLRTKTLAIWDLDNTLTDTLKFWGTATLPAVRMLAHEFSIPEDDLMQALRRAPSQYRFCDFGALVGWLDDKACLLPDIPPGERRYAKKVTKSALRQMWYGTQKKMTVFYPGALETLQQIKAQGTANVIYTDTEASSLIRRFWLLAYNARRRGLVKDEQEILDLIDHFYCMPSIEDDQAILRDCDVNFALRLKEKMSIWRDNIRKPSIDHTGIILADFGTKPKNAVFIGDSNKDGSSARPAGVDFAWCRFGVKIDPETMRANVALSAPEYKFGIKAIRDAFGKTGRPSRVIRNDLRELFGMYDFAPGKPFNGPLYSGTAESSYPRTDGGPEGQNRVVHRLAPAFRSPERPSPLGPATHFEPETPAPTAQAPDGTAGPGTQDSPPPPSPV